jgi:hypothetical protein
MGARQWAGQADTHMTLTLQLRADEERGEGRRSLRTVSVLSVEKARDDVPPPPEAVAITSEKDGKRLLWSRVESEGRADPEPTKPEALARRMAEKLAAAGPMKSGELAEALKEKQEGPWDRARKFALDNGLIAKVEGQYGVYRAVDEPEI